MPVLNANMRAFNSCGISEITQFLFCGSSIHMHFVSARPVEMLHTPNSTVFILCIHVCTFLQYALLLLAHWWVRKEWKKELWVFHLSLPFYDIILCKWLANTGKDSMRKGYINSAPWSFVFLRMPLPSFCVQTKLLVQSKHSLSVTGWSLRWAHLGRDE